MKRFDISAEIKTERGFLDDPDYSVATISTKESKSGKWVEHSEAEKEIRSIKLQLETMTNDRDAEKGMKATARNQRDKMTKKYSELVELLRTTGVLQYDDEWAEQIQNLITDHKSR